jgi:hypothetical protein
VTKTTSTLNYLGGARALNHAGEADVYNGRDPETGETFTLTAGVDEVEASTAHAAAIADTFPGCFQIDGKTIGDKPAAGKKTKASSSKKSDPAPAADDLHGQLMAHTRADLNAAAAQLNIENPDQLPNKAAVVDAIVAAKTKTETEAA